MGKRKRNTTQPQGYYQPAIFEEISGLGLVVCVVETCQYVVWPEHIKTHCREKIHNMSLTDSELLAKRYSDPIQWIQRASLYNKLQSVNQPIPQLPLYTNGLLCQANPDECHYICRQVNGMQKHYRSDHGWKGFGHSGRQSTISTKTSQSVPWKENVSCQRLCLYGEHSSLFEVCQSDLSSSQQSQHQEPSTSDPFLRLLERGEQQLAVAKREINNTIGDGEIDEINPWLERTRWISKLKKLERRELMACIAKPDEVEEPLNMAIWNALEELVKISQDTLLKVGIFIRMNAARLEHNQQRHHPLQPYRGEQSLRNSIQPWQNILMFFARTQDKRKWKKLQWRFTIQQTRAWKTLKVCAERSINGQSSDLEQSLNTTTNSLTVLQKACLHFCISLLDQKANKDEYDCAMIWALAVLGVKEDSWKEPQLYTPILSAIIKLARFFVIQKAFEDVGMTSSESEQSDDCIDLDGNSTYEVEMDDKGCSELVKDMMDHFMVRGTHGPMEWMLDLRSYGMKIAMNSTVEGSVHWDGDILLYKSLQLSMPAFRSMVHGLVNETRRILIEELMLMGKGAERNSIPIIPWRSLRDNPTDDRTGWNFLKDKRNQWPVTGDTWLLDRIKANTYLQRQFHVPGQFNRVNSKRITMYMVHLAEFREKLLVLMHITGGQPARAPEILSIRHSNTINGGIRNIFIENGLIVFVTRYHKGYQITGDMKIIHRYLPLEVGELVIWYLWLVLPLVQILEASGSSDENEMNDRKISMHMWPKDSSGGKWSSVRMRKVMIREFSIGTQIDINIASYRQIAIAISRKWLRGHSFKSDDDDEEGDWDEGDDGKDSHIADLQAAHTSHIAGIAYARNIFEMSGVMVEKRMAFRQTSIAWHEFLEFESTKLEIQGKKRSAETSIYKLEAENARIQRWKRMRTTDWIKPLQQVLGPTANFRGVQESALKAIGNNDSPIIVVMPTGEGKSLLFMLPALFHSDGLTVVVVPLISLREDFKRRCEEIGIICREWNPRNPPDAASIVLITPEATTTDDFATFFNRIRITYQLDRVVIDECHILLDENENFRPMIRNLSKLKAGQAQMILLTGTLPVSLQPKLYQEMGFLKHEVKIFRNSTTRKNLKYSVEELNMNTSKDVDNEYFVRLVMRKYNQLNGIGKLIVFCNSIEQTVELSKKLECESYYSKMNPLEKTWVLNDFKKKKQAMIVATSALGMGIDIPNVRLIFHFGRPRNLLEYAQQTGRAGRDRKPSEIILVVKKEPTITLERSYVISKDDQLVFKYISSKQYNGQPACRRIVLDEYLDGRIDRKSCEVGEEKCDVCLDSQIDILEDEYMADDMAAWSVYDNENETGQADETYDASESYEQYDQSLHDEYDHQAREMKLAYRREVERTTKDIPLTEVLVRALQYWFKACSICAVLGKDDSHDFAMCERLEKTQANEWAEHVTTKIRFANYSGCFSCGVPQSLCHRWQLKAEGNGYERNSSSDCQYPRVMIRMLAGVCTNQRSQIKNRWKDRLKSFQVDIDDSTKMMRYLQQKHVGEYKTVQRESNNMVWEFFWLSQQMKK